MREQRVRGARGAEERRSGGAQWGAVHVLIKMKTKCLLHNLKVAATPDFSTLDKWQTSGRLKVVGISMEVPWKFQLHWVGI